MPDRSQMQKSWEQKNKCPRCDKLILFTHTYEFGGQKRRTVTSPKDPAAVAECPSCHGHWFYFERPTTIETVAEHRSIEPAFDQELVLDNSKGETSLKRIQTISREWVKTISIEKEQSKTLQLKAGLSVNGVGLEAMAEQALRSKYSLSEEEKYVYTDQLDFDVPAGTRRNVLLTFNYTWQHGRLILAGLEEEAIELPFKFVDSLTMDVAQTDRRAS